MTDSVQADSAVDSLEEDDGTAESGVGKSDIIDAERVFNLDMGVRRAVRENYRLLINKAKDLALDSGAGVDSLAADVKQVNDLIGKGNKCFQGVGRPTEYACDSQLLLTCSHVTRRLAASLDAGTVKFDAKDFGKALSHWCQRNRELLETSVCDDSSSSQSQAGDDHGGSSGSDDEIELMDLDDQPGPSRRQPATKSKQGAGRRKSGLTRLDWRRLGTVALDILCIPPTYSTIHGTFEPEVNELPQRRQFERQARQRVKPVVNVQIQSKEGLAEEENSAESQTMELVQIMNYLITQHYQQNEKQPISYWDVVIDPGSFSRSVENMFHFAFLVKDNLVALSLIDGRIHVEPVPKSVRQDFEARTNAGAPPSTFQGIMPIDVKTWKELISIREMTEPVIMAPEDVQEVRNMFKQRRKQQKQKK